MIESVTTLLADIQQQKLPDSVRAGPLIAVGFSLALRCTIRMT